MFSPFIIQNFTFFTNWRIKIHNFKEISQNIRLWNSLFTLRLHLTFPNCKHVKSLNRVIVILDMVKVSANKSTAYGCWTLDFRVLDRTAKCLHLNLSLTIIYVKYRAINLQWLSRDFGLIKSQNCLISIKLNIHQGCGIPMPDLSDSYISVSGQVKIW